MVVVEVVVDFYLTIMTMVVSNVSQLDHFLYFGHYRRQCPLVVEIFDYRPKLVTNHKNTISLAKKS